MKQIFDSSLFKITIKTDRILTGAYIDFSFWKELNTVRNFHLCLELKCFYYDCKILTVYITVKY